MMKQAILVILVFVLTASSTDTARKANKAYEEGNYAQAVELYKQAIKQDSDNAKLQFNLASALYKMGKTEEAMQAYDQFENMTETPEEQALGSYNQGTMLTEDKKYKEAIDYFREALKKNPDDPDARHNYELAMKYQQQQEKQKQQQKQDDQGKKNDQENKEDQQQKNNQDQQDQNQQDQQPPKSGQQQNQQEEKEDSQPMPKPTEMTPEEAKNILDALAQLERKLLENMKKESTETQSKNGKDW